MVSEIECDVIVAGSGPSGANAARICAEAGMKVVMLDSKMEIGAPVICADSINIDVVKSSGLEKDSRLISRSIQELSVTNRHGKGEIVLHAGHTDSEAFNTVVERDRLDKELVTLALEHGANLKIRARLQDYDHNGENFDVRYRQEGKDLTARCKYLVLATGLRTVARPGKEPVHPETREYLFSYSRLAVSRLSSTHGRLVLGTGKEETLSWYIPRSENTANTLKIMPGTLLNDLKAVESSEKKMNNTRPIVSGYALISNPVSVNLSSDGSLNAGSFAGLFDHFFMTGFREAYISGELAAQSILSSERGRNKPDEIYRKLVSDALIPDISASQKLRKAIDRTSPENLNLFLEYLSGCEFNEISAAEIIKSAGLGEKELDDLLPEVHDA